jgi:PD-(D/E)XK nuclease superfamily
MTTDFTFDAESHVFTHKGNTVPSVTQILARSGLCDFSFLEEEARKYFLKRGRSVHWLLQLEDEGGLNYRKVPKFLRGYRKAYLTWKERSGFEPKLIEHKFVSRYGFAGIIDRVGMFPPTSAYGSRTRCVLDFKTGATQTWVKYQLAAYTLAIEPNVALARRVRRIGLSLFEDATYKVTEFPLSEFDSDISKFMEALHASS